jgi:hypothetical protein
MMGSDRMRAVFVVAPLLALIVVTMPTPPVRAETPAQLGISWERDKKSPHWVHGQVDVATPPAAVWTRFEKVPEWPRIFSDIKWLEVKQKEAGDRWRIRLETRSMDCGAHDYVVSLDSKERRARLEIDAPGIDSKARLIVRAGSTPAQANVAYSLYVRATGIVGWFVSEKTLRKKQEQMVARNLADLQKAFGLPKK